MKKIIYLFTFLFVLGCSSDGDEQKINTDLVIGNWDLIEYKDSGVVIPLDECEQLHSGYLFNSNNTCVERYGRFSHTNLCINNQYQQTYTLENNVLKVKQANDYEAHSIVVNVTSTGLVLEMFYSKEVYNNTSYERNYPEGQRTVTTYVRIQ